MNNCEKSLLNQLEIENSSLKAEIAELKRINLALLKYEGKNRNLVEEAKIKDDRISELSEAILENEKKNNREKYSLDINLNSQINYYRGLYNTGLAKFEAANKIIGLNELQHHSIEKLEERIDELHRENEENLTQLRLSHERRFTRLKKAMMERIKDAQKSMAKKAASDLLLNEKLSALSRSQALNELEQLSCKVEELSESNRELREKIKILKEEVWVLREVGKVEKERGKRFKETELILKSNSRNKEDNINSIQKIGNSFESSEIAIKSNKNNLTQFNEERKYEKMYRELMKENERLSSNIKTLKSHNNFIYKKYSNLFKLFSSAMENISGQVKNSKNIFINYPNFLKKIENSDFSSLSDKEKYAVLTSLMKVILPVINCMDDLKINDENLEKDYKIEEEDKFRCRTMNDFFIRNKFNIDNKKSNLLFNDKILFGSKGGVRYLTRNKSKFKKIFGLKDDSKNYCTFNKNSVVNNNKTEENIHKRFPPFKNKYKSNYDGCNIIRCMYITKLIKNKQNKINPDKNT